MGVLHLLGSRGDGGAETYFVDLVSALHDAGIEEACALRGHPARAKALAEAGVVTRSFGFGHLVGNTRDIADWIVAQGWPSDRVSYIPNFAAAAEDGAPVSRASLDTPHDAPLLLGMGRLHDAKAHDVSLKALTMIPGAYLWIAGDGPLEGKLKAMATALGVEDRVRFLGWRRSWGC